MATHFRVSRNTPLKLAELGVSVKAVLERTQLPAGFFNQEKIVATTEQFFAIWRAVESVSGDPSIGFKLGTEDRVERLDPPAIAALCSPSFRDALQRMARYKQLTCPEKIIVTTVRDGECAVEFEWLLAREGEPKVLVDLCLSWILSIGRRGIGANIAPLRVELMRNPEHQEMLEEFYRCRINFNAERNALVFRSTDLDRSFVTHNADLVALISPQLDAQLNEYQSSRTVTERAKSVLKRLLPGQRPSVDEVARQMGLSSRTLQRRLTESGVRFQQLLKDARRELARYYLSDSRMELNDAAYLLGFEDPNSFIRAFQRWEGTTPARFRKQRSGETQPRIIYQSLRA
jgi:AraC-like DNA-binding protein